MYRKIHILFALVLILIGTIELRAQDPQFSQVFNNPLYLNPAFAGDTHQDRASFSHRRQWTKVDNGFVSYSMGYDHNFKEKNLGLGFSIVNDRAGINSLATTQFMTSAAKEIRLNRNSRLRIGIEGGVTNRSFDRDKLLFWSEIQSGGEVDFNGAVPYDRINYFDSGIGAVYYSNNFWGGFSVSHLNRPEHSFLNDIVKLDRTFSIHAGTKIPLDVSRRGHVFSILSPVIHYKVQGTWNQLDIGSYYEKNDLRFGLWYRGLPIQKKNEPDYRNSDALVFLIGARLVDQLQIGYSYDLTLSNLTHRSGGSHEISMVLEWPYRKRKGKDAFVPCPRF